MATTVITNKVIKNVKLMLDRRGYNNEFLEQLTITNKYPHIVRTNKILSDDNSIMAVFIDGSKVTIDVLKIIMTLQPLVKRIIIIFAKSLTPDAKHAVSINKIFCFETFSYDEMLYDPIIIVPKHYKLLDTSDIKEINKLPIILSTDRIARYYNFNRNDIIAIEEFDIICYRRCV